jgi:hypothetical protein
MTDQHKNIGFAGDRLRDFCSIIVSALIMEGMWFVSGADNRGEGFYDSFKAEFGSYPQFAGASDFDLGKLFAEAAQQHRPLNEYLHTVKDFNGKRP